MCKKLQDYLNEGCSREEIIKLGITDTIISTCLFEMDITGATYEETLQKIVGLLSVSRKEIVNKLYEIAKKKGIV